jgi:uncharacterized membrane protein YhaH (DUF805 family)
MSLGFGFVLSASPSCSDPQQPKRATTDFKLWSTAGRIGRLGYFSHWLIAVLIAAVINTLLGTTFDLFGLSSDDWHLIAKIISAMVGYSIMVPAAARRFQDIGSSGWWTLTLFIPIVFVISALILFFWPGKKNEVDITDVKSGARIECA